MITLGKMAGGTGITAMDHLGMLSRFVNNTATGFTTSDTALKNQIEQWAGATDITNADEMAKLAAQEIGKAYGAGTG